MFALKISEILETSSNFFQGVVVHSSSIPSEKQVSLDALTRYPARYTFQEQTLEAGLLDTLLRLLEKKVCKSAAELLIDCICCKTQRVLHLEYAIISQTYTGVRPRKQNREQYTCYEGKSAPALGTRMSGLKGKHYICNKHVCGSKHLTSIDGDYDERLLYVGKKYFKCCKTIPIIQKMCSLKRKENFSTFLEEQIKLQQQVSEFGIWQPCLAGTDCDFLNKD